ncbi:MAG: hypothetical protein PHT49_02510 [Desulfovibrionales bacterium]|nr:hypothetical protein [Desulfovibrionales bacterium]
MSKDTGAKGGKICLWEMEPDRQEKGRAQEEVRVGAAAVAGAVVWVWGQAESAFARAAGGRPPISGASPVTLLSARVAAAK